MNHKGKQSKRGTSERGGTPWRQKLSTKIISCVAALSLVFTVPLPALAQQASTDASTAATTAEAVSATTTTEAVSANAVATVDEAESQDAQLASDWQTIGGCL